MFDKFKRALNVLWSNGKNSMSLGRQFLKYGGKALTGDWSAVVMSDQDLYSGYGYAGIRNRANTVARIATKEIFTESKVKDLEHPYLETISSSRTFSDYSFWQNISVYLDLEGVYFLMAIRGIKTRILKDKDGKELVGKDGRTLQTVEVGKVVEFKMLNPYDIRRVMSPDGLTVAGYVENKKGYFREIPKDMIIEIRDLNPFDDDKPYSMTDAAKDSQFTLKSAGDYTRHALKGNINAPGILSTDVALEEEDFKNFTEAVKTHKKGEPIFGNGGGAIKWENMQTDLNKAALKEVNEIGRDNLFAVTGVSKTMMGIEQSGTTRDTARVQKDLFVEGHILPRVQLIVDALNQDYKNHYPDEYKKNRATILIANPLETDQEAELKGSEVKTSNFDLYNSLIDKGYKPELAAKYVEGEIDLKTLGKPTGKPVVATASIKKNVKKKTSVKHKHKHINRVDQGVIGQQQGALQNTIVNIEEQLVSYAINKINDRKIKNDIDATWGTMFDSESKFLPQSKKSEWQNELELVLVGFYGIIMTLEGSKAMTERIEELALMGVFKLDKEIKNYIKEISKKVSESHINTVSKEVYETARKAALRGLSQEQIVSELKTKYNEMVDGRAQVIARTETNRAFTRAQFEADRQFVEQNELEGRVYKQWRTRSDNPCDFCKALESEGLIPFDKDFRKLGGKVSVGKGKGKKSLDIGFEALQAGNAHPNCSCIYELIIKD